MGACAATATAAGCGGSSGGGAESSVAESVGGDLWQVPEPPGPVSMTVDGEPVDPFVVDNFVRAAWSEHYLQHGLDRPLAEVREEFLADPRKLFTPLVRGVLQVREAERRFPELDSKQLAAFLERMRTHAGGAYQAIVRRHGEAAARAHAERRLRMDLLLEDFRAEVQVDEDEVFELYERDVLAELGEEEVALAEVRYEELAPRLRARLERERAEEALGYWLDSVLPETEVAVELPGGRSESW